MATSMKLLGLFVISGVLLVHVQGRPQDTVTDTTEKSTWHKIKDVVEFGFSVAYTEVRCGLHKVKGLVTPHEHEEGSDPCKNKPYQPTTQAFHLNISVGLLASHGTVAESHEIVYEIHQERKTWEGANIYCKNHGMTLACIRTYKEHIRIRKFVEQQNAVPKDRDSGYWLGGKDTAKGYKWLAADINIQEDDETFMAGWHQDEPNREERNGMKEACIELRNSDYSESLAWNDLFCEFERGFICQSVHRTVNKPFSMTSMINITAK